MTRPAVELHELHPGAGPATAMAKRVAGFLSAAERSLELALYDVRLPDPAGATVRRALEEATARGVQARLVYNLDHHKPIAVPPPPSTRPDLIESLPFPTRGIPGIPDLMHHKYVVRDGDSVWTGSTNWTQDAWTLQENVVVVARSGALGAAFAANFDELWEKGDVEIQAGSSRARSTWTAGPRAPGSRRVTDRSSRTGSPRRSGERAGGCASRPR